MRTRLAGIGRPFRSSVCSIRKELGEVQTAHVTEAERTTRQPLRRARGEPFAEIGDLLRRHHCPDRHANLMWHGSAPCPDRI